MEEMSQAAFFAYLECMGCEEFKKTKHDFVVYRNVQNGKKCGIQNSSEYFAATICKYCTALRISPPPKLKHLSEMLTRIENEAEAEE